MMPRNQALYNYPLGGRHFQEDNMTVYCLLSDLISGTTGFVWVQPFDRAQNGRAAWLALLEHYEGGDQKEKCMAAALSTITSLHYWNESVFSFEDLNSVAMLTSVLLLAIALFTQRWKMVQCTNLMALLFSTVLMLQVLMELEHKDHSLT